MKLNEKKRLILQELRCGAVVPWPRGPLPAGRQTRQNRIRGRTRCWQVRNYVCLQRDSRTRLRLPKTRNELPGLWYAIPSFCLPLLFRFFQIILVSSFFSMETRTCRAWHRDLKISLNIYFITASRCRYLVSFYFFKCFKCCGPGSVGSICFLSSWIRILYQRIRIPTKENLYFYYFATFF